MNWNIFTIFCYEEKWELLQPKLLHFLWDVLLLNVKNFELLRFLELLNRKNRQLVDVQQRIRKLFGICVLQMNRKFFFQKCYWQIYFEFDAFFLHDHVTNCCHRLLTTRCTKIDSVLGSCCDGFTTNFCGFPTKMATRTEEVNSGDMVRKGKELWKALRNNPNDKERVNELLRNGAPPNFRDPDKTQVHCTYCEDS